MRIEGIYDAGVSAKHPHEPEIPPTLDSEGRCLVCALLCQIDKLTKDCMAEQGRTNTARAWFAEERKRTEKRSVMLKCAAQRLEALERIISVYDNDGDSTKWRQEEVRMIREVLADD